MASHPAVDSYINDTTKLQGDLESVPDSLSILLESQYATILRQVTHHISPGGFLLSLPARMHDDADVSLPDTEAEDESGSDEVSTSEDDDIIGVVEELSRDNLLGPGTVCLDGRAIYVHEWLGEAQTNLIQSIHNTPPIGVVPGLKLQLHDFQRIGVEKIRKCWDGPTRSCLLADSMGLGKTIQSVVACVQDTKRSKRMFNLVVTTKSCASQWKDQIISAFHSEHCPNVFVLDDPNISATDLINSDFDFVICSYGFVQAQYRALVSFKAFFEDVALHGQRTAEQTHKPRNQVRKKLSLFSSIYGSLGLRIPHLLLDEYQFVKNHRGKTHQAIKALDYDTLTLISGTPIANRWWDLFGAFSLMKGHPIYTLSDFFRIFGDRDNQWATPRETKQRRLVKFLMGVTIARPASLMNLPGMEICHHDFSLSDRDAEYVVLYTQLFLEHMQKASKYGGGRRFLSNRQCQRAIIFATKAQQYAAHPDLVEAEDSPEMRQMLLDIRNARLDFVRRFSEQHGNDNVHRARREFVQSWTYQKSGDDTIQDADDDDDDTNENDPDYDPNKVLVDHPQANMEEEIPDGELPEGKGSFKGEGKGKADIARRLWKKKLQRMTDNSLMSSRMVAFETVYAKMWREDPTGNILVFSRYLKFLDLVDKYCLAKHAVQCLRIDGTKSNDERQSEKVKFQRHKGQILLMTPDTGGVGFNGLEGACRVIQCEVWWNGNKEEQAYGRVFRTGQLNLVRITVLMAVDSSIDALMEKTRNEKATFNQKILGPLRRLDEEEPQIPDIVPMFSH